MKGKNPAVEVGKRRARIFQMLRLRATHEQILKQLKEEGYDASDRTFSRDMAAIKESAKEWVDSFAKDGLLEEYQQVVESLKDVVRRLNVVQSEAQRPADKIAANVAIKDVELEIHALLEEGPTMWALKRKGDKVEPKAEESQRTAS